MEIFSSWAISLVTVPFLDFVMIHIIQQNSFLEYFKAPLK